MAFLQEQLTLFDDENIIATFRAHPLRLVSSLWWLVLLFIGLFFVMFWLWYQGPIGVGVFVVILFYIVMASSRRVLRWYGTLTILTNKRVLNIRRGGLFKKNVDEIPLSKIMSLSYEQKGGLQALANIGNIILSLRDAIAPQLVISYLSAPQKVLDIISHATNGEEDVARKPIPIDMGDIQN